MNRQTTKSQECHAAHSDDGLLSNLAGSLRERRVSLKHMPCHSHGKLMLAQKHLAGNVFFKGGQLFIAVGTHNHLDVRIHGARESRPYGARPRYPARATTNMRADANALESGRRARRHCRTPPRYHSRAASRRFHELSSTTTIEMPFAVSAVPMRRPTRP